MIVHDLHELCSAAALFVNIMQSLIFQARAPPSDWAESPAYPTPMLLAGTELYYNRIGDGV